MEHRIWCFPNRASYMITYGWEDAHFCTKLCGDKRMETIKPCPFCGHTAQISRMPGGGLSVLCTGCGALVVPGAVCERKMLVALWNRRDVRPNFQQTSKIKPCPFCASRIDLAKIPGHDSILKCMSCGLMVSFVESADIATSVALWNRRISG